MLILHDIWKPFPIFTVVRVAGSYPICQDYRSPRSLSTFFGDPSTIKKVGKMCLMLLKNFRKLSENIRNRKLIVDTNGQLLYHIDQFDTNLTFLRFRKVPENLKNRERIKSAKRKSTVMRDSRVDRNGTVLDIV